MSAKRGKSTAGFTLVEVMIAMVILASYARTDASGGWSDYRTVE